MGLPDHHQAPGLSPHLYPQALQLKLYQAFIFSIPILFSIILFLLFYLFYLKRRASSSPSLSTQPGINARITHRGAPYLPTSCRMVLKGELKNKLPIVVFDEELGRKDSQCCVCLGEFEMEEELLQVPSCKHVFHVDCIHHWLHSNSTCPLCRCSISGSATAAISGVQPPQHQSVEAPLPSPELSSSSEAINDANNCSRDYSVVLQVGQARDNPS